MKLCVITGAAAGIGRALADRFAREGYAILGVDVDARAAQRATDELTGAGAVADFVVADLGTREGVREACAGIAERCAEHPADALVHNAGINAVGRFKTSTWERQRKVVDVNLVAPMVLTADLLARGRLAPNVKLVFLSSLSHFVGYPGAASYAASKDGLASYAASLHTTLASRGGHVLTVYPGPVRTEHARRHSPDNSREAKRMPPDELADRILRALARRRRVLVPGVGNNVIAALGHVLPRTGERAMKKAILDRLD